MRRYLVLAFFIALSGIVFQNCSVPNESTLNTSDAASTSTTTSTSTSPLSVSLGVSVVYSSDPGDQLMASGGHPPYQYSLVSGFGSVNSIGTYTPSGGTGAVTVMVTDSLGASSTLTFTVNAPTTGSVGYTLIPVYRAYNASTGDHLFTTTGSEVYTAGYAYEGISFNVFPSAISPAGIYRCFVSATGDHYLSNYSDCSGNTYQGFLGYLERSPTSQVAYAVYRCVQNSGNHMHLETLNTSECASGWTVEGILGYTK